MAFALTSIIFAFSAALAMFSESIPDEHASLQILFACLIFIPAIAIWLLQAWKWRNRASEDELDSGWSSIPQDSTFIAIGFAMLTAQFAVMPLAGHGFFGPTPSFMVAVPLIIWLLGTLAGAAMFALGFRSYAPALRRLSFATAWIAALGLVKSCLDFSHFMAVV